MLSRTVLNDTRNVFVHALTDSDSSTPASIGHPIIPGRVKGGLTPRDLGISPICLVDLISSSLSEALLRVCLRAS